MLIHILILLWQSQKCCTCWNLSQHFSDYQSKESCSETLMNDTIIPHDEGKNYVFCGMLTWYNCNDIFTKCLATSFLRRTKTWYGLTTFHSYKCKNKHINLSNISCSWVAQHWRFLWRKLIFSISKVSKHLIFFLNTLQ